MDRYTVLDVELKVPDNYKEGMLLDKYLTKIEDILVKETVSSLFNYLKTNKYIIWRGEMLKVDEAHMMTKDSFNIISKQEDITAPVNSETINQFHVRQKELFQAEGYNGLRSILKEVKNSRKWLRRHLDELKLNDAKKDNNWKDYIKRHSGYCWNNLFRNTPDLGLEERITEKLQSGFGGRGLKYTAAYNQKVKKNLRSFAAGLIIAQLFMFALSNYYKNHVGRGILGPVTGPAVVASGEWNPKGKPMKKPGQSKPDNQKTDFEKMQDKYLNKKPSETNKPERMRDVRKKYWNLTKEIVGSAALNKDNLVKPEGYFPPDLFKPLLLEKKGEEYDTPDIDNEQRNLVLILDVTGSMPDPENILDGGPPSSGYFLATQFVRSYADMGAPISVIRYPIINATPEDITRSTSVDGILDCLLWNNGGADDNGAIERLATLYITESRNWKPADVVFITDSNPTKNGCIKFMDLEQKVRASQRREKDNIYWISVKDNIPDRIRDGVEDRNIDDDRHFYVAPTIKDAIGAAEKIVKGYEQ